MRRTLSLALLGLCLTVAAPARADIYTCTSKDGRTWVTNRKVKGARCKLGFRTPKAKHPKRPPAGSGAKAAERFTPRSPSAPRGAADEPADRAGREALYGPYIEEASALYDIPEAFIRAVIRVESNFKYRALSSAGAQGLMQLMPVVVRELAVGDPFDPRQNVLGGTRLLRVLANRFDGDLIKVLSAYYAGSGAVKREGGVPTEDTEGYVRAVLDRYYQYKALGPG